MGGRMIDEQEEENREVLQHSPSKRERILVLYASQTGNAMDAAERVGREAERRGCPSVAVLSMDEYDASCLPREHVVIFVVSTTGQGDIPDSMKVFWRYLLQRNLSREWLAAVHYAVFGLGDSGYQKYNYAAKKLDKRLSDIGGKPLIEKGLGDDQHPSGYEGTFDPWLSSLWNMVHLIKPSLLPSDSDIIGSQRTLESPKFQIIYHSADQVQMQTEDALDLVASQKIIGKARSLSPGKFRYIDERPQCLLRMVTNQRLSEVGQEKDVRHFEFESLTSVLDYKSGDVLEVLPCQNLEAVNNFIRRCNLDPDVYITVLPKKRVETSQSEMQFGKTPVKLKKIVELTMDVASASPRRYFFEVMSFFATAEHERERLQYFSSPEGRDDLYQYNQKERRTILEVLEDFPSVNMPFEWLVQLVPPLKTRGFSISSSPLAHPREVHLTVSVVSWRTPFKRERFGLCSSWLASLDPKKSEGVYIPAWIHPGALPPPKPSIPLILVGPGTGCAPFHAFIEERAVQSASQSTAPIVFFFGCRNEHSDFLYRDFWLSHAQDPGVLSAEKGGGFFVAFSRDQPHKVYVQHKMKEESARVWNLLSSGASIYIAGSSDKMPADVTAALEDIVSEEGGVPKETAARWLKQQERAGKFHIEAWS